ncbi:hypothetical protein E2320_012143 [Naja naja]|nr:hypothetical protein E2320_012143 [Naja naja]
MGTVVAGRAGGVAEPASRRRRASGEGRPPSPSAGLRGRAWPSPPSASPRRRLEPSLPSTKLMNIKSSFANQLLLVSLLEHLCHVYAQDPMRSRRLFQLLCKTFTQMGLLSDFAICEEFSSLRLQHNRAITELMKAADKQIRNEEVGHGDSYRNRENEILFEAQTSRYVNEFEEISKLGKGGYGTVYKVKNKLDGQFYAIKKILIKKATKRDCMKVLREVKVLAQLQHPNIVGYHTAWMEHVQPACGLVLDLPSLKVSSEPGNSKNSKGSEGNSCTLPPGTYSSSSDNDMSNESRDNGNQASLLRCCNENGDHANANDSYSDEDSKKETPSPQPRTTEYHLMLHIQMQLCETSLCDWIATRNDVCLRAADASNPYHHIEKRWTLKVFQELLEGVYYIHTNGVMHRDIKEDTIQLLSAENNYAFIHTSGVGTCLYASPEQLQGSHYDFKSDMYSLGVILFELFQPFGTEMERTEVLMGLRRGSLPLTFCGKWPIQARYVKLLTSSASSRRPTALQLLESELFHNSANIICVLQQKVMEQEEEIKLLKEKIKLLLQERDERDRIKPLGSPV